MMMLKNDDQLECNARRFNRGAAATAAASDAIKCDQQKHLCHRHHRHHHHHCRHYHHHRNHHRHRVN